MCEGGEAVGLDGFEAGVVGVVGDEEDYGLEGGGFGGGFGLFEGGGEEVGEFGEVGGVDGWGVGVGVGVSVSVGPYHCWGGSGYCWEEEGGEEG